MSADNSATLLIRVTPRAGRTEVAGWRGDALLIRLAAAPVDGTANDALVEFLASLLRVPRRSITIVAGERSRNKRVRIANLSADQLTNRMSSISLR